MCTFFLPEYLDQTSLHFITSLHFPLSVTATCRPRQRISNSSHLTVPRRHCSPPASSKCNESLQDSHLLSLGLSRTFVTCKTKNFRCFSALLFHALTLLFLPSFFSHSTQFSFTADLPAQNFTKTTRVTALLGRQHADQKAIASQPNTVHTPLRSHTDIRSIRSKPSVRKQSIITVATMPLSAKQMEYLALAVCRPSTHLLTSTPTPAVLQSIRSSHET